MYAPNRPLFLAAVVALVAACAPSTPSDAPAGVAPSAPQTAQGAAQVALAPLRIVAWNANSGIDADAATHDGQLPHVRRVVAGWGADNDVIALSEVGPHWMDGISNALAEAGHRFGAVRGETGRNQRLMLLFDEARFELSGRAEMSGVTDTNARRAPLVVTLRDRASGQVFEVLVAHLTRGRGAEGDAIRAEEARRIASLLRTRSAHPIVAVGDFNMDCPTDSAPQGCAPAFDAIVENGVLTWVRPSRPAETTCTDRYHDMLDLAFVGRGAERWEADVEILGERSAYCEPPMQSGAHFPIRVTLRP